jgi:myo-inositol-1(or 4)-monophosphatase
LGAGAIRETGCPAMDLAWVAAGKFDAFMSTNLDFAEIAAGDLIVREAGGKIEIGADTIATNGKILG